MIVTYRYSNDNIYIQPLLDRAEDKANILLARADWRADGVIPTKEFDDVFPIWISELNQTWKDVGMTENTKAEAQRVGMPTEDNSVNPRSFYPKPFYLIEMVYEKSTNDFVGFTKTWLNGTHSEHIVTCYHPDQRGKGYHDDMAIINTKAWFLYSGGESASYYTPKGQSSYYVSDPNAAIAKTRVDRVEPVDYIENKLTKADWTTWMNQADKQADRDANFLMQRYLEI